MTVITFLGMSLMVWLVDSLVVRRILMSTIRRYLSTFPENSIQGLKFYRMSSINKSALAVFYLFILAMYFTLVGSINSYNSMTQKKLREFGKSQLEQIALRIQAEPGKFSSLEHVREIINETPSFFGSEITLISDDHGQNNPLNSVERRDQRQWLIVEKELPGVGKIRFTLEKEKLRAEIISSAVGKNFFLLFIMLLGIGAIIVFQMKQEFKGTLSVINRITDEMSSGNLGNAERLYATDEFWGLYQKLIVVKNNAGKVIGDIREHARILNQNIRVVEEVSHFLQQLSSGQKPLMRNAGDAVSFVDGFAENLQHSISELSLISERTSSTSIEFAASINQVKNSMGKLVGLAEAIAGTVRENTSSLKDISSDIRTASGMSGQVEENIRDIYDSLGKRIVELGDSKFIVDKQMESTTLFEQSVREVESHLNKLSGMYVGYQKS
ncbi:MAG: methyl-accepting chemotaxis protein, partial [Acidobacteria bacterium]|nr:methyl-accepting chemotaxis protein [Acidobacteriota bacterium]